MHGRFIKLTEPEEILAALLVTMTQHVRARETGSLVLKEHKHSHYADLADLAIKASAAAAAGDMAGAASLEASTPYDWLVSEALKVGTISTI